MATIPCRMLNSIFPQILTTRSIKLKFYKNQFNLPFKKIVILFQPGVIFVPDLLKISMNHLLMFLVDFNLVYVFYFESFCGFFFLYKCNCTNVICNPGNVMSDTLMSVFCFLVDNPHLVNKILFTK